MKKATILIIISLLLISILSVFSLATLNVTTLIVPSLLYTNTTLQGYCNITGVNSTNLTLSAELTNNSQVITTNSNMCYQEFANQSTSCGGLSTGGYACGTNVAICNNAIDGNWATSTHGLVNGLPYSDNQSYVYMNYTKPVSVDLTTSKWQVKRSGNFVPHINNYTIPDSCDASIIQLRNYVSFTVNLGGCGQCFNTTTGWVDIFGCTSFDVGTELYEEAMFWNMSEFPAIGGVNYNILNYTLMSSNYNDSINLYCNASLYSTYNTTTSCYQESTDTVNQTGIDGNCGLQYNGTNQFVSSVGSWTNTSFVNDGDWATTHYTYLSPAVTANGNYSVNYTKPANTNGATWNVRLGTTTISHLVIPNSCLNAYTDKIVLQSHHDYSLVISSSQQYCYNGTSYELLRDDTLSGGTLNHLKLYEEAVNWSVNTTAINITSTGFITNLNDSVVHDLITFNQSLFIDNSIPSVFPQVGDTIQLNGSATSRDNINVCQLQTNISGSWVTSNSTTLNNYGSNINLPYNYVVTNNSVGVHNVVYWKILCNDSYGTNFTSLVNNFTVVDTTSPVIVIGNNSLNINPNNRSILSADSIPLFYNLTYNDPNLFAMEVNVTCEQSGQIYYFANLNLSGTQSYTKSDNVSLNGYPLQRCNFFTAVSDSHTAEEISPYNVEKLDNGLSYLTEAKNIVQIVANEDVNSVDTIKLKDRQTFDFTFNDAKTTREYTVVSDKILYYIPESKYPAHFVVYNTATHQGNWIDFTDKLNIGDTYNVEKVNDYEYNVIVTTLSPTTQSQFSSIGGTLISNYSLYFYIGGTLYLFSNNTVTYQAFGNYTYVLTNIDSFPGINTTNLIVGVTSSIQNISSGNYTLDLSSVEYFPRSFNITVNNDSQNITYSSFQSQVDLIFRNVKTLVSLTNVTYNITSVNYSIAGNTGNLTSLVLNLDASTYTVTWSVPGYYTTNQTFTTTYQSNQTIYLDTSYLATFILYDEQLSTTTGNNTLFNIAGATSVSFLLFCPSTTSSTLVNTTNFTIPITCDYSKFQFLLLYNTSSYYRSFILDPSDTLNYPIYLIDGTTTPYLFNSLIADDLLSNYINPSIYVLKTIGNQTVQITADFADIEQKIGAYLIENGQYIVEIHSNNLPTFVMGTYAADVSGTKSLRLYQVSIYSTSAGTVTPNIAQITVVNTTQPNSTLLYRYQDDTNLTSSVSVAVYQNNNVVPICSDTLLNNNNFVIACPITNYNASKVLVTQSVARNGVTNTVTQVIKDVTAIPLAITQYFGQDTVNWFLIIVIASLALFGTIQTANLYTLALVGIAVLFNIFGWLVMSTSVLAFAIMVALIAVFKEGDKVN
jgi:hypothetical protein